MTRLASLAACLWLWACQAGAQPETAGRQVVTIAVDAGTTLHRINPDIYGVSFATAEVLRDLNLPLNRSGGNSATLYDWRSDARNTGADFFFESLPATAAIEDQFHHGFVAEAKAGGAQPILTIPAIGWTAKLGPERTRLAAFSVRKYGTQQEADTRWFPDAGNGRQPDGTLITVNDPHDAARPVDIVEEAGARTSDLVARWGSAGAGGVAYYAIDNEPSLWHLTHRQVQKEGVHAAELAARTTQVARGIKAVDPQAKVLAPEAWGWPEYFDSGFDANSRAASRPADESDRVRQTDGMDLLPWLLRRWRRAGHPIDVVSVHYYPQGGEYNDGSAGSRAIQLLRNRSTRALWDEHYRDESWIDTEVALIPRLRRWVNEHYAQGTPIAITEYNWGGENSMSGATAQADIWGIFGRHGLDMGVRWAAPNKGTPVYLAMRLVRNPDGSGSGFGESALSTHVPDPDTVSAFAAKRDDGALTVLVVNKSLEDAATIRVNLQGAGRIASTGAVYRLVEGKLGKPAQIGTKRASLTDTMPPQSVALYVLLAHGS